MGEIYAPVSGQVKEVNQELEGTPELINQDPETTGEQQGLVRNQRLKFMLIFFFLGYSGWLAKIQLSNPGEFDALLNEQAYDALCKGADQ